MRLVSLLSIIFVSIITIPCYAWVTGKVVDNETSQPIEGAVVYVEWNVTKGLPGLTYTDKYKTKETLTDENGKFSISGIVNPFPYISNITIYKKGFIAWNNHFIFETWENREDWKNGSEVRLVKFTPDYLHYGHRYNYYSHVDFIEMVIPDSEPNSMIRKAIEWEENNSLKESKSMIAINITGKVIDAQTGEPIPNALCVVAGYGTGYSMSGSYSEFFSDVNGNITISGTFPMIIRPPYLLVYKRGYIAWESYSIFPNYHSERRQDFKWQEGYIFKLEKWNQSYSHREHHYFMESHFPTYLNSELNKALEWEMEN